MKYRTKKRYDRPITDYLRTVTNRYDEVVMDEIRENVDKPFSKLRKRMNKLNAVWYSDARRDNAGKRYYWCRHRIGGPAFINEGIDAVEWYVEGMIYCDTRQYCEACGFSGEETLYWVLKYGDTLPETLDQL
jgi:hypothetical protein